MRVLLVEDSRLDRALMLRVLEARGHEVVSASDVATAWERLQEESFALALVDLRLEGSDGLELLSRIRGLDGAARPHCVVLTGSRDPAHVRQALERGADDFMRKELLPDELDVRLAVAEVQAAARQAQRRSQELQAALYRISEASHSAETLDRLCERVYAVLSEITETPNFYIALLDRESRVVSFPFWRDEREPAPAPRVDGRGLTEHVLRLGEPLLVDRPMQERLSEDGTVPIAAAPPDYWLGVPLRSAGAVVGMMGVFSYDHSFRIGEEERSVLDFVSDHVATAIEHLRTQEALRRKERMAAMGELVAGVAHEIRNPLFGLSALLDALEPEAEGRVVTDSEYVGQMRGQIHRLGALVEDLLEYGRPHDPELETCTAEDLLREAIRLSDRRAAEAGVSVALEACDPAALDVDRKRLVQVFQNLVDNAVRFSSRGGSVRVTAEAQAGVVLFRVRDEGPGFRVSDLPHVFEPFFTRRKGGTGLGLSIAQRIVDDHRGAITARNAEAGGALVEVALPLSEA